MELLDLPTEILTVIFQMAHNSLSLTQTCVFIRDLIEDCSPLMGGLLARFLQSPYVCPLNLFSRRRYVSIEALIPTKFSGEVFDMLELQKKSLRYLRVIFCHYDLRYPFLFAPYPFIRLIQDQPDGRDVFGRDLDPGTAVVRLDALECLEMLHNNRGEFERHLEMTLPGVEVTYGDYEDTEDDRDYMDLRMLEYMQLQGFNVEPEEDPAI